MTKHVDIYALADPRTETVRYIGQSVNVTARTKMHLFERVGIKGEWIAELAGQRLEPTISVLTKVDASSADRVEREYIQRYLDMGCNLLNIIHNPNRTVQVQDPRSHFTLRVTKSEHAEITEAAREDDRKPADWIRYVVRQHLRTRRRPNKRDK